MIKSIELVDFLSHSDTKLEFDDDTSVFVGQNGACLLYTSPSPRD